MSDLIVAVDGPAGSGKSSVSKQAARQLRFGYLDTGAGYRALTKTALDAGVELESVGEQDQNIAANVEMKEELKADYVMNVITHTTLNPAK